MVVMLMMLFTLVGCGKKEEVVKEPAVEEIVTEDKVEEKTEDRGRGERVLVNQAEVTQEYESRDTQTQGGGSSVNINNGSIVQPVTKEESEDSIVKSTQIDNVIVVSRTNKDDSVLSISYNTEVETDYEVTEEILNEALESETMSEKTGAYTVLYFNKQAILGLGLIDTNADDEAEVGEIVEVDLSVG